MTMKITGRIPYYNDTIKEPKTAVRVPYCSNTVKEPKTVLKLSRPATCRKN